MSPRVAWELRLPVVAVVSGPLQRPFWSLAVMGKDGKLEEPIRVGCAVQNELLGGPKAG